MGRCNLLNGTEWRNRTRKSFVLLKMTQCAEYSKFELRRITTQLIDNYTHNGLSMYSWWNELHTCSEKWWTRWDSQASEFNSDFKESLIIFCQRRSGIYLQCNDTSFRCVSHFTTTLRIALEGRPPGARYGGDTTYKQQNKQVPATNR